LPPSPPLSPPLSLHDALPIWTPYVIPESGATVVGALGYLACGQEIAQQNRHGAPPFDTIAITAFSGGSHAGLLMAKQVAGLAGEDRKSTRLNSSHLGISYAVF